MLLVDLAVADCIVCLTAHSFEAMPLEALADRHIALLHGCMHHALNMPYASLTPEQSKCSCLHAWTSVTSAWHSSAARQCCSAAGGPVSLLPLLAAALAHRGLGEGLLGLQQQRSACQHSSQTLQHCPPAASYTPDCLSTPALHHRRHSQASRHC
jgi:hypothetical protein